MEGFVQRNIYIDFSIRWNDKKSMPKIKILFIHHSTGANLIRQGKIREKLFVKYSDIEFWDHSYNLLLFWPITARLIPYQTGLSDQNGKLTGIDYSIKIANTDPQGYADLFSQEICTPQKNSFSKIISNFDVVMFKSCFPTTKIESDKQLQHYKDCYFSIQKTTDKLVNKLFLLFTPPPLRKEMTKPEYAVRAREFSIWMKSPEFLRNSKNVAVFDFFNNLAGEDSTLRREYCPFIPFDSHPNKKANIECSDKLVTFIVNSVNSFIDNKNGK